MDEGSKPAEETKLTGNSIEKVNERSIGYMGMQKNKNTSNNAIKIILYIVIGLALLAGAVGIGYMWRDITANDFKKSQDSKTSTLETAKNTLEKQLADEKAKYNALVEGSGTPTITPCIAIAPGVSAAESIKASITSGNTSAITSYLAATVTRIFVNTVGAMVITPNQTVPSLTEFITSDNAKWDYNFALSDVILNTYRISGTYGKYFPTIAIVGKATNKKVISFSFDCTGKIDTIFMADNADVIK